MSVGQGRMHPMAQHIDVPADPAGSTTEDRDPVPPEAREEHRLLSEAVDDARWRYYVLDSPTMSDAEFDSAMRRLEGLEGGHPSLRTPHSPTQKGGGGGAAGVTPGGPPQRVMRLRQAVS